MKQSERLLLDADAQAKLIESYRQQIDLRTGQIDKLRQEMESYQEQINSAQMKHDQIIQQSQQEQQKEAEEEQRRHQQMAMNAALSMEERQ